MFKMSEENILLLFLGVIALSGGMFIANNDCPANEEYLLCGTACPFNCSQPTGPVMCSDDCVESCFCKAGFLRNDNGTCVDATQCIGAANNSVCGPNEEFLSCGSACPLTCAQPEPLHCGVICSMGCFCISGYVRDLSNNQCVTLDQCPIEQCLQPNEVYDMCNSNCQATCADPEPVCMPPCEGGCVCATGLLRNAAGECVSVERCPPFANTTRPGLLGRYLDVINRILQTPIVQL